MNITTTFHVYFPFHVLVERIQSILNGRLHRNFQPTILNKALTVDYGNGLGGKELFYGYGK